MLLFWYYWSYRRWKARFESFDRKVAATLHREQWAPPSALAAGECRSHWRERGPLGSSTRRGALHPSPRRCLSGIYWGRWPLTGVCKSDHTYLPFPLKISICNVFLELRRLCQNQTNFAKFREKSIKLYTKNECFWLFLKLFERFSSQFWNWSGAKGW